MLFYCRQSKSHGLLAAIVCVIISLRIHFWLRTCLPRITHILFSWTVFVLLSQRKQFIRVNRMPYIAHTLIWLTVSFVLPNHKQFIWVNVHYCRMVQTRRYDQRPFDEIVCDAIIANGGVKKPSKKVQNVYDGGCIKHSSDFSCLCDARHTVQFN